MTVVTQEDFKNDVEGVERAAEEGPVLITDGGEPRFVVLRYEDFAEPAPGRSVEIHSREAKGLYEWQCERETFEEFLDRSPSLRSRIDASRAEMRRRAGSDSGRTLAEIFAMPEGTSEEALDYDLTQPRVVEPRREIDFD